MIYSLCDRNDPTLYTQLEKFDFNNPPIDPEELSLNMIETMRYHKGVGLAANQCGFLYNMFVIEGEPPYAVFNPRIVAVSNENVELEEGCLSFPNILVKVIRPKSIKIRFQVPSGATVTKEFTGMTARIMQHEAQHLIGKTFLSGLSRLKLNKIIKDAKKKNIDYSDLRKILVRKTDVN